MKKFSLFLLVCMFSVVLVGCNDKNTSKEENKENNNSVETKKTPEWVDYLLSQNITEIVYKKGILEHNDTTGEDVCTPDKILTKEQLKEILVEMTSSNLVKEDLRGLGGACDTGIYVKYDDKEFKIYASKDILVKNNDEKIISLIEKEKYTKKDAIDENTNWAYRYNWDTKKIETILNK